MTMFPRFLPSRPDEGRGAAWREKGSRDPRAGRTSALGLVPVKLMDEAMERRGQEESGGDQEDEPRVEGVEAGEQLAAVGTQRVDRPHAPQQHGGVQKAVPPGQTFE